MDMNGQWPVSPWDFASGRSRSYSQSARSPILHRSRSPASVCWWMPHMWIGTLCSTPNHAKCPTCQILSCVKCNTLPRDSLHHFLYWSSEDFWNRSIQGGTTPIMQCHCQRWHLGFGKLAVPLWELVLCTRWQGLLGSHSHEPMFPCFHLPPSY